MFSSFYLQFWCLCHVCYFLFGAESEPIGGLERSQHVPDTTRLKTSENIKHGSYCRDAKTWKRRAKIWLYGHLTPNDADHESRQQLQHDAKDFIPASLHIPEL